MTAQALARDGFRCMVTGMFDYTSIRKSPELKKMCSDQKTTSATVQACHILNESTMQGIDPSGGSEKTTVVNRVRAVAVSRVLRYPPPTSIIQTEYAATVMTILRHLGLGALADDFLKAEGVHNLGNLLSLGTECHDRFDNLDLWLEGSTNEVCCS
jgi:hypothetical protein